jgi:hypothetical protein
MECNQGWSFVFEFCREIEEKFEEFARVILDDKINN